MNNSDRPCAECRHSRRYWSSLRCLRGIDNPTRNDEAGAEYCEQERRAGRIWSWLTGVCGYHGQHFEGRSSPHAPGSTPRLVYLAIHDDDGHVTGYVFGSPAERDAAMAKYAVEGIYTAATAEIVEDVP